MYRFRKITRGLVLKNELVVLSEVKAARKDRIIFP